MRCTIGTTVVMTGLVVAMLAFRPPVIDDPSVIQAQADPAAVRVKATAETRPAAKKAELSRNEQANAETRRKLDTLMDVDFNETPFNEVLQFIGTKVGPQFYVDGKSLTDASIATDTPITLRLKQVPAEMALDLILQALQAGYTVRSGVVIVRTQTALAQDMETNVYHVSHEAAQRLAEIIPITIATDTWNTVGGPGSMAVFYDSLIISHTPEVHQRVGKLLKDLEPVLSNLPRTPMPQSVGMMPSGYPGAGYGTSSQTGYGQPSGMRGGRHGAPGYGPSATVQGEGSGPTTLPPPGLAPSFGPPGQAQRFPPTHPAPPQPHRLLPTHPAASPEPSSPTEPATSTKPTAER